LALACHACKGKVGREGMKRVVGRDGKYGGKGRGRKGGDCGGREEDGWEGVVWVGRQRAPIT